ncbi:AI-2E family transporter [Teichococcus aestuarii]|nr:AI-2E family transporter [Pseudoroseomonas aestuarii]
MAEMPPPSPADATAMRPEAPPEAQTLRVLQAIFGLLAAAFSVTVLALGRDLIVPLVLAVLLAFVLAPVVVVLHRLRVPQVLGVVAAVLLAAAAILGLGVVMGRQAGSLTADLPAYQQTMAAKLQSLRLGELMQEADAALRNLRQMMGDGLADRAAPGAAEMPPPVTTAPAAEGGSPLAVIGSLAGPVLAPLATAGIVLLFAIFVLVYREDLRDRLIRLAGSSDLQRTTLALDDAARRLSRYFLAQVALNSLMGVTIALILWLLGLPAPALWGILAGLMRFVPFIGTFIALVPPLLLAVAVDPGWSMALWVLLLFLVAEPLMAQVLEPAVYGHSTGLSPVAVIVAATFWTFLWGPIGLLLATPLTVCLVVLGRHVPSLGFLDVMLGDRPPLQAHESFYQRALQRDTRELSRQAQRELRAHGSLSGYLDAVGLPALALADRDWSREELSPERMENVRAEVSALLEGLEAAPAPGPAQVVCAAGRGPLDDLTAAMAVRALGAEGLGAVALPAEAAAPDEAGAAWLCCLSVLEAGNTADGIRYLLRRLQRQFPQARIVVGLWQAEAASPLLAELRLDASGETIVTSLGELVALSRARPVPGP